MGFFFNDDYRIHINLSNYAWNVINEDMFNFYREDINNKSGFINDIIINFYQDANASLQIRCDEISSNYEELLSKDNLNTNIDPSILYSVIDVATNSFKTKTINEINSYPKDSHRKIKLRKQVAEILEDSQENEYYSDNVGSYIKALIEEYTRLPFIKRESIFCKQNHELIENAISHKKQLRVTTRTGKVYDAIPYKITTDKLGIFNYLIALDTTTRQPVTYRISKITIKVLTKSGRIDPSSEKLINDKLITSDVSFLTKDNIRVVVRFDKYGMQKYNSQLHMRPAFIEKLGEGRYVFNCSEDQIKYYFIKFGSSAVIEEPVELANYIRDFYKYALTRYNEIHNFED